MTFETKDFEINEKLSSVLASDTPEEREGLFADLDANGLIDPLIVGVFPDGKLLLDGHNRCDWLAEHPDAEFEVKEINMPSIDEGIIWICARQLNRRNLVPIQRKALIDDMLKARVRITGGDHRSDEFKNRDAEDVEYIDTAQEIADEYGISRRSVYNAQETIKALDAGEDVCPGFKDKAMSGEIKVPITLIDSIETVTEKNREEYVKALENNNKKEAERILADDFIEDAVEYAKENDPNFDEGIFDTPTLGEDATFHGMIEQAINDFKETFMKQLTKKNLSLDENKDYALNKIDDVEDILEELRQKVMTYYTE